MEKSLNVMRSEDDEEQRQLELYVKRMKESGESEAHLILRALLFLKQGIPNLH